MSDNSGSELKGFLNGVFWGALVGTVFGIVIAPKSGEDTRKDMINKAKELSEMFSELFQEGGSIFENLGSKISSFTMGENSLQKKLDQLKSEIEKLKVGTE
jgi:gas vesicle protein